MSKIICLPGTGEFAVLRPARHCVACGHAIASGHSVHGGDFAAAGRECGVRQPREFCFRCSEVLPQQLLGSFPLLEAA